jgi:hypothetical protein
MYMTFVAAKLFASRVIAVLSSLLFAAFQMCKTESDTSLLPRLSVTSAKAAGEPPAGTSHSLPSKRPPRAPHTVSFMAWRMLFPLGPL